MVKGMFVGKGKNSTNSVSNALGIFILKFSWFEREKIVGFDGVCLSLYVNMGLFVGVEIFFTKLNKEAFMGNFLDLLAYY